MSTMSNQERGGCLTAWLAVMLLANAAAGVSYIVGISTMQQVYPNVSSVIFLLLAGLAVVNLVSVYGLWTWKKWGFYLFIATASVALLINISMGIPLSTSLFGLIGIGILGILLRDRWQYFT
ncbi:MAG: hypothetical protein ABI835_04010 [Chloroflexota bacterium]